MQLVLLSDSYLPNKTSVARMIHELAVELMRQGHKVMIVTSTREIAKAIHVEECDGIRICRVNAGKGDHISRVSRAFAELALPFVVWRSASKEIIKFTPDIVVSYSPTIFWGYLVWKIKRASGCRAYLVLRDIFPQWMADIGLISKYNPAFLFFCGVERLQYWVADRIGVQSPSNLDYFSKFPQLTAKVEVLWNWAADENPAGQSHVYRNDLGLAGKTVFFYGGNMGVAQRMDRLIKLATAFASSSEVHFVLVGEGSERERLKRDAETLGLKNITILPPVAQDVFLQMLHDFDVGVVLLDPELKTHNIPGKLISYAAAGKPILADVNLGNDLADLLRKHRAGLVSSNDDSILELNARLLADDEYLRNDLGVNAKELANQLFSVRSAAEQIAAVSTFPR